jgi:SulP family sulfate permease
MDRSANGSRMSLIGLTFFLLGFFRLGSLVGFFPRHILVGCIGGVGVFLIITGFNVATRLEDDEFSLSLNTVLYFLRAHNLALWVPAFALAVLLRVITSRWHHQLILPTCAQSPVLF